jgi:hypothetical protein
MLGAGMHKGIALRLGEGQSYRDTHFDGVCPPWQGIDSLRSLDCVYYKAGHGRTT